MEDWQDFITTYDREERKHIATFAARQIRNLTIDTALAITSKLDNMGAELTALEKIEARNKEQLPSTVYFKCDPYSGLSLRTFELTLNILADSKSEPQVMLRMISKYAVEEKIAEEFKEVLSALNSDIDSCERAISPDIHRIKIYLGTCA